jgi:putative hydrolase of the HAD superfamily
MSMNGDRPRAVFFDLDDTLLDGYSAMQAAWGQVCAAAAARTGGNADRIRDAIRREASTFWKDEAVVGHWRVKLDEARAMVIRLALESEGLDGSHAVWISQDYAAAHRERLDLFPDALETLAALRDSGRQLGLLTNGPRELQRGKVTRFDLEHWFDVVVIEGEFGKGKPEAAVFEHALAVVGAQPHEAWHIGDNLYADIRGAQQAGIHAAWIHRDRLTIGEDAPAKPDRIVGHLDEVRAALGV